MMTTDPRPLISALTTDQLEHRRHTEPCSCGDNNCPLRGMGA